VTDLIITLDSYEALVGWYFSYCYC
jgi:hypothetical protein